MKIKQYKIERNDKNKNLLTIEGKIQYLKKTITKPKFLILLFFVGLFVAILTTPLKQIFDRMFLVEYLQANQCCVIIPFIIAYTILTTIGIPGTLLTVAGGVVFGIWWGTLWSVIGATLGALGAFLTARYLLRDYIKNQFKNNQTLAKFDRKIIAQPIAFVLAVRFAPISPFNVVNFLFGLTPINWLSYTVATFFGIIPGTLAYTWLGTSGIEALEGNNKLPFFFALSFLTLLSIVPLCLKKSVTN